MLKDVSRDVALKFRADGTARPFAGNTIICHLPQESRLRDAFVDVHKDLFRSGFARKLGILSTASLHMTIFTGAEDQEREGGWPSYVPKNASMQDCTNMVLQRMKDFRLQCNLPFRMVIDAEKTRTSPGIGVIQLRTIDEVEEEKLRRLRDRLSKTFGFRGADHDSFGFHVTLAYQLSNFTATEKAEYRRILERCLLHLTLAPPALELGIPEFCVFADMNRFDTELLLRT